LGKCHLYLNWEPVLSESGLDLITEITSGDGQVVLSGTILSQEGDEAIITNIDELGVSQQWGGGHQWRRLENESD